MSDDSAKKKDDGPDLKGLQGLLGETVKKVFTAGVSAAFVTEEHLKNYIGDLKVPKEALQLIMAGAAKSKDEITAKISKEAVALIQKIDVVKELSRFAETHTFKITAEIDIKKKPPESLITDEDHSNKSQVKSADKLPTQSVPDEE